MYIYLLNGSPYDKRNHFEVNETERPKRTKKSVYIAFFVYLESHCGLPVPIFFNDR